MDFPWYTHHETSFHGGFIGANNYGNSMEFQWFRRHGFSMVHAPWNFIPWGFIRTKKPWEIHGILVAQTPWIFYGACTHYGTSFHGASYRQKPMEILWWISMTYISWKWIPCGFYSGETYRNLTKNLWHINHDISIIDISRQLSFKGASTGQTHGNKMELLGPYKNFLTFWCRTMMKPFPRTYEMDWRNVLQLLSWKSHNRNNNAIVDYNSPALCTPVTLPPIGDAAYRQHAGGGLNHGHRQHAQTSGQSNLT